MTFLRELCALREKNRFVKFRVFFFCWVYLKYYIILLVFLTTSVPHKAQLASCGYKINLTAKNVTIHDPDLLFFSGDQIYEANGGYWFTREPLKTACLDYLRKWYMFGWAFRDLMRRRPSVTIPDDHDVYQANLWGASGRKTDKDDKGGYLKQPEFVNMVERTQSSHLPEPYDRKPVEQNIEVYYTSLNYGRISFAIIEGRKFKSGPNGIVPKTISGRADHVISKAVSGLASDDKSSG